LPDHFQAGVVGVVGEESGIALERLIDLHLEYGSGRVLSGFQGYPLAVGSQRRPGFGWTRAERVYGQIRILPSSEFGFGDEA